MEKRFRVKIIIDNYNTFVYDFDNIQDAVGYYDEEMKKDHNELEDFCISVQEKNRFGFFDTLIFFHCAVEDLNVLLKSS